MKLKLIATVLGLSLMGSVNALEIGHGTSKSVTNSVSKTVGLSHSVDRVNGIEVNRLKKGNKRSKKVTRYGSVERSASIFGSKTRASMVDTSSFSYAGDLVTGHGKRSLKSKTIGGSLTATASHSWYAGYETNRNGQNYSKERFSGFEGSFSGTSEKFKSKTATTTSYKFSD